MGNDNEHFDMAGIALAAFAMAQGTLAFLRGKGTITASDADKLLDGILVSLERLAPPDDPSVQQARKIIETVMAAARTPSSKPEGG